MTAKTYRLPAELGGGEYTIEDLPPVAGLPNHAPIRVPSETVGAWYVLMPKDALTEVKPALPEEPPVGAVVLDSYGDAWQRFAGEYRGDWICTANDAGDDWQNLNELYGPLVRLVPDPFAEPVELPWASQPYEPGIVRTTVINDLGDAVVDENSNGRVACAVAMSPAQARAKARALCAAAVAVERAS